MKVFWKSFLFFVLCLLIALMSLFPLRLALQFVQLPQDFQMEAVNGSVFNGSAGKVSYRNFPLHNVEYSLIWNCLIQLSVCIDLQFEEGNLIASYHPISEKIELVEGKIKLPLDTPGLLPPNLLIKPKGALSINSINATLVEKRLSDISVIGFWHQAGIEGEEVSLGDYRVEVNKQANLFKANISDISGLLKVKGDGVLDSKAKYAMNIQISTRPGLPQSYKNAIELIAKSKKPNQYELKKTGKIPKHLVTYLSFGAS